MRFDLVALNESYRGIDRSLSPYDFVSKKAKKNYNELISCYFEYTELMCSPEKNPYNSDTFNDLLEYYKKFKGYDVNCEIIVYDSEPLEDAFGKQIQLLGIDVVCDMAESLLEEPDCIIIKSRLNQFGLCRELNDVNVVVQYGNIGDLIWEPCWVYHVNTGDGLA